MRKRKENNNKISQKNMNLYKIILRTMKLKNLIIQVND